MTLTDKDRETLRAAVAGTLPQAPEYEYVATTELKRLRKIEDAARRWRFVEWGCENVEIVNERRIRMLGPECELSPEEANLIRALDAP